MEQKVGTKRAVLVSWLARVAVLVVFVGNLDCALRFLLFPESYVAGFELSGTAGATAIQGLAVAFLMWNATYPLVIVDPVRYRVLFAVVLAQQAIGLVGESLILSTLGDGHPLLGESIMRFIAFDAFGLVVMALSFVGLMAYRAYSNRPPV